MDDELSKILGGDDTPPAEKKEETPAPQEDPELKAKREQSENLDKAIKESQEQLRKIRSDIKKAKTGTIEEEELPKINLEDPSAKAWDKHIRENVAPMQNELEREKDEVRQFALKEFLKDKPALSKSPEKLKDLMGNYERIRTSSERTREGVLMDLDKAYAATFHEELLAAAQGRRFEQAEADAVFSDIAVSRGATSYAVPKDTEIELSEDDKKAILGMGYSSVSEWIADKKKFASS